MSTEKNIFAKNLDDLIKDHNYTHQDVAKGVDVTRQAVGKWVKGESVPDVLTAGKLANFFNVSVDYLAGISPHKTQDINLSVACDYIGISVDVAKTIKDQIEHFDTSMGAEYSIRCTEVVSKILTSDTFWDIAQTLIYMNTDSNIYNEYCILWNQMEQERSAKKQQYSHEQCVLEDDIEFYDRNVDLNRYHIARTIEKINDIFDNRIETWGDEQWQT